MFAKMPKYVKKCFFYTLVLVLSFKQIIRKSLLSLLELFNFFLVHVQEDVNVICVDWSAGAADPNYVKAAVNTRLVGKQVGKQSRGNNNEKKKPNPSQQRWYAKWKLSWNILYEHTSFCTFGADFHAQPVLNNKISASELSEKFIKSTLLVGYSFFISHLFLQH